MNTTSRLKRGAAVATALVALGACIQGPWDYYPNNPAPFYGVYLTGYAISGRPLDNICFERVQDLAEGTTNAFAFFDSADVKVTGQFNGSVQTLTLTPLANSPTCFQGSATSLLERGQAYAMDARLVWDSAGQRVTSRITGMANIPDSFSIHRTGAAPSLAKTGGIPENVFTLEFFAQLPPNVQEVMFKEYGDTLSKLQSDTAALAKYFRANGTKVQARLVGLLEKDQFTFKEGDTLFYLNGALNTLSHYYASDRSPDVKVVLITQRFDPNSERPQTRFDSFLGLKPDSSQYYFPGDIRRLIAYPNVDGDKGWNLLDSIGIVNTWYHTRRNRLYFYAFEKPYLDYLNTTTGGAGNDVDSRVKTFTNLKGGQGVFAGAIPDSFDIYIKTDSLTKSYSLPAVHGAFCREEGWFSNKDCREFYPKYCKSNAWGAADCQEDAIESCLEADLNKDAELKAICSPIAEVAANNPKLVEQANRRFCIENNFPLTNPACAELKVNCQETKGENTCKQTLWVYCVDNLWKPEPCNLGLVSYCKDRPRLTEVLCKHADDYCRANPGATLCK
jgi:hypothetical protein